MMNDMSSASASASIATNMKTKPRQPLWLQSAKLRSCTTTTRSGCPVPSNSKFEICSRPDLVSISRLVLAPCTPSSGWHTRSDGARSVWVISVPSVWHSARPSSRVSPASMAVR